ncbi:hypothetical protein GWN42_28290 [candidate division KSB1 bacterium]|nr:hypothetical protein [candidate division KSB1 bacterium]
MNEAEREKIRRQMQEAAGEAREETDELLEDELLALRDATKTDLDALRPQVTDKETYDKLIAAVNEATQRNESIAQLKSRIENLGEAAVKTFKEVTALIK